jgi:hypothetical protein
VFRQPAPGTMLPNPSSPQRGCAPDTGPATSPTSSARRLLPRQASSAILFISAVMSIPVGHHAMHRPQPTQPDMPNWSCQVPNL